MLYIDNVDYPHNAREIWEGYGAPGEFRVWIRQIITTHKLTENIDYLLKIIDRKSRYGQPRKEVMLSEAALRKIQLGYGKGKHVVQSAVAERSVEIDELLRNPRRLAQIFLEYADTKDKLELLHHSDCVLTMQEIAKDLGYESAYAVNEILVQHGYMYRDKRGRALPYAHKVPSDCYAIKAQEAPDGRIYNYLKWTLRGKEWIAEVLQRLQGA